MAIYISQKVSDPLENPTNSQIQYYFLEKPNVYAGLHVVLNLLVFQTTTNSSKFDLFIRTVHQTFQQIHPVSPSFVDIHTI